MTEDDLQKIEKRLTGVLDRAMRGAFPSMHAGARKRLCAEVADIVTADVQSAYHDILRSEQQVKDFKAALRQKDREIGRIRVEHRDAIGKIVTTLNKLTEGLKNG